LLAVGFALTACGGGGSDFDLTQLSSSAAIDGTLDGCVRWRAF
jgi:hypothetical protein